MIRVWSVVLGVGIRQKFALFRVRRCCFASLVVLFVGWLLWLLWCDSVVGLRCGFGVLMVFVVVVLFGCLLVWWSVVFVCVWCIRLLLGAGCLVEKFVC